MNSLLDPTPLLRMVDERFGRLGKAVTTACLALAVLVFLAFAFDFLHDTAVQPLLGRIEGTADWKLPLRFLASGAGWLVGGVFTYMYLYQRMWKPVKKLRAETKAQIVRAETILEATRQLLLAADHGTAEARQESRGFLYTALLEAELATHEDLPDFME